MAENTITGAAIARQSEPVCFERSGAIYANSRDVAAYFEKDHRNVLQSIDNLLKSLAAEKSAALFVNKLEFDEAANREIRSFDLTRDGFTLLCMGFTGEKALNFKLRYIEKFNEMERALNNSIAGLGSLVADLVVSLRQYGSEMREAVAGLGAEMRDAVSDLGAGQREIKTEVVILRDDMTEVKDRVRALESRGRRNFKVEELRYLFAANLQMNNGDCVGCQSVRIINVDERPIPGRCQIDHRNGDRHDHRIENAVPLCPECHQRKARDHEFNARIQVRADMLHERRLKMLTPLFPDLPVVRR